MLQYIYDYVHHNVGIDVRYHHLDHIVHFHAHHHVTLTQHFQPQLTRMEQIVLDRRDVKP